ncbi:MAG: prolyl oligopeptidase family serine peptidase [Pseudonocardia sp.]
MTDPPYPDAPRLDLVDTLHGHRVADPYRRLEDAADPCTKDWSIAQDELAREHLDALPGRDALAARLHGLLDAGWVWPPVWRAGRRFVLRREPGGEHGVLHVTDPGPTEPGPAPARVLLDPMALDPSGRTTLDAWAPDPDGRLLAYKISTGGDEQSVLHVLEVATGEPVDGPIDRCHAGSFAWVPGGAELVYVRKVTDARDDHRRRIHVRLLGTGTERLVEAPGLYDDHTYYAVRVSRDGRWLVVSARVGTARRDSVWIGGLDGAPLTPVLTQADDVQCHAWVERDGRLYLLTTDGAPRWRLAVTDPGTPGRGHWRELVAEDPGAVLDTVRWLERPGDAPLLVVGHSRHAVDELALHSPADGARVAAVPLPGTGHVSAVTTADPDTPAEHGRVWIGWTDLVTPDAVHRFDAATGTTVLETAAPGAVDVPPARTGQRAFTSADGTTVRMFVVEPRAGTGPRPVLLTGYGGFGISRPPAFSAAALSWVAAGGTYALVSLRGGGEEGDDWHRAGNREHKRCVFDDFHAAAQSLVDAGDTTPEQLAIMGGSNGGLLVGAALTQRPELYRAVVCSAPLLDMVRYEEFLLGRTWNDEYGTAADPVELGWLLSYSPYHHVRDGETYPAVLFTVYDADTRVDPLHARKMCAALQHATAGDPATRPVLLRRETGVGHGARAVSRTVALTVDQLAFLAAHTGLRVHP